MNITLNSSAATCTRLDLSSLPATRVDRGSRAGGIFLMIFALLWGGIPTVMLISTVGSGKFEPGALILLVFTVIGAGMLIGGLNLVVGSTTTVIDENRVMVKKKSLFGANQWSEQLSAFEGILSRSEYHQGGKNQPSYTLYIVEMRHADKKKAVKLYESRSDLDFRAIWEGYCRRLNMPAVETDGKRLVKRAVSDLDKSVKDLVREGKLKVEFDPSKPPPAELALRVDGDTLELTVVKKKSSPIAFTIALLIPCVFIYIGFFVKDCPVLFGIVGILFFVLMLAGLIWSLVTKEQIRIGKEEILVRQLSPRGIHEIASVRAGTIEQVRIGKKDGTGPDALLMETDDGTIEAGKGLSNESLEWLKNCIVRVISV